jgi:signal transduction histidine kinase
MTNVVRHARATRCRVRLTLAGGRLRIGIEDDGRGIDLRARSGDGLGIESMRERAEELGGTFAIEPALGGGTRVEAVLPVNGR